MIKKIYIPSLLALLLAGCGGGENTSGVTTNLDNEVVVAPGGEDGILFKENNTTIPINGIYESTDSEHVKYLKVVNYARSIGRECKNNDGTKPDPSRGFFPAAKPLSINNELYAAALEHSIDLADSDTFSHDGSGTIHDVTGSNLGHPSSFVERIESNGYTEYYTIGENIAGGQRTIEDAVHSWLESPGHCANIMKAEYKEMGLAKYENPSSSYKIYWTQNFGG